MIGNITVYSSISDTFDYKMGVTMYEHDLPI